MHIAVDMDDVTMEFYSSVLQCVEKEFGVKYDYDSCTDWDKNELKSSTIFGKGKTWWDWLKERDWLWATFPAVDGAIGGIRRLRQAGHYVEACTSKPEWAEWTVWSWLGKWRPPFNSVTIVPSGVEKYEVSNADILIDDRDLNCIRWVESTPHSLNSPQRRRNAILYDRPWNRATQVGPASNDLYIAHDWDDVLTAVANINLERSAA